MLFLSFVRRKKLCSIQNCCCCYCCWQPFFRHFLQTISYVIRYKQRRIFTLKQKNMVKERTDERNTCSAKPCQSQAIPIPISMPCNAIYTIKFQWIQLSHCSWFLDVPTIKRMKNEWVNEWLHCMCVPVCITFLYECERFVIRMVENRRHFWMVKLVFVEHMNAVCI